MVETVIPEKIHPTAQAQDAAEPTIAVTSDAVRPVIGAQAAQVGVTEIGDHIHADAIATVAPLEVTGPQASTAGLGEAGHVIAFSRPNEFPPVLKTGQFKEDGGLLSKLAEERIGRLAHKPGENYTPPAEHPNPIIDFIGHLFSRKPKPAAQAA